VDVGEGKEEVLVLFSADVEKSAWKTLPPLVVSKFEENGGSGKFYFTAELHRDKSTGYYKFVKGTMTCKAQAVKKKKFGPFLVGIDPGILASFMLCGSFELE